MSTFEIIILIICSPFILVGVFYGWCFYAYGLGRLIVMILEKCGKDWFYEGKKPIIILGSIFLIPILVLNIFFDPNEYKIMAFILTALTLWSFICLFLDART